MMPHPTVPCGGGKSHNGLPPPFEFGGWGAIRVPRGKQR